jgi:Short C-terminal domain
MTTEAGAGTIACPSCTAPNAPTAKFCGSCGAAMAPGAGPTPPPLPPTPPPMPPMPPPSRFGMGGMGSMPGAGFDAQSIAPMAQRETFDHIVRSLPNVDAQALGQQPPSSIMVEVAAKKMGMNSRYRGMITLQAQGAQQTVVQVKLGVDWGSTIPSFLLIAGFFVVMWATSSMSIYTIGMAGFYPIFGILALAATAWQYSSLYPKQVANTLLTRLSGGGAAPAPNAGGFKMPNIGGGGLGGFKMPNLGGGASPFGQSPQQPPMAAPAAPPPAAAAEPSAIEALERLAKLRDSGIVTAEEFEAKKAEILKRL